MVGAAWSEAQSRCAHRWVPNAWRPSPAPSAQDGHRLDGHKVHERPSGRADRCVLKSHSSSRLQHAEIRTVLPSPESQPKTPSCRKMLKMLFTGRVVHLLTLLWATQESGDSSWKMHPSCQALTTGWKGASSSPLAEEHQQCFG